MYYIETYNTDAFAGLIAGSKLVSVKVERERYLYDKLDQFCERFSEYILNHFEEEDEFLLNHINELNIISSDFPEFKECIYYSIRNLLDPEEGFSLRWNQEMRDLYGGLRGFLMLTVIPKYSYIEIMIDLAREGESSMSLNIASRFIGAYLGLNKLMAQGVVISERIYNEIDELIK